MDMDPMSERLTPTIHTSASEASLLMLCLQLCVFSESLLTGVKYNVVVPDPGSKAIIRVDS